MSKTVAVFLAFITFLFVGALVFVTWMTKDPWWMMGLLLVAYMLGGSVQAD